MNQVKAIFLSLLHQLFLFGAVVVFVVLTIISLLFSGFLLKRSHKFTPVLRSVDYKTILGDLRKLTDMNASEDESSKVLDYLGAVITQNIRRQLWYEDIAFDLRFEFEIRDDTQLIILYKRKDSDVDLECRYVLTLTEADDLFVTGTYKYRAEKTNCFVCVNMLDDLIQYGRPIRNALNLPAVMAKAMTNYSQKVVGGVQ